MEITIKPTSLQKKLVIYMLVSLKKIQEILKICISNGKFYILDTCEDMCPSKYNTLMEGCVCVYAGGGRSYNYIRLMSHFPH